MTMTMPIQEQCQGDSSKQSTTAPPEPLTATTATPPTATATNANNAKQQLAKQQPN